MNENRSFFTKNRKIQKLSSQEFGKLLRQDSKIHIIYSGSYYLMHADKIKLFILDGIKNYKINTVLVTLD